MYQLHEIQGKKVKASNGNIGTYARWQGTPKGIRVWLEDEEKHVVGSILLKDIERLED